MHRRRLRARRVRTSSSSPTVTRGPQHRVGRVDLVGNAGMTTDQVMARLRARPGQPFAVATLNADLAALEDAYRRMAMPPSR